MVIFDFQSHRRVLKSLDPLSLLLACDRFCFLIRAQIVQILGTFAETHVGDEILKLALTIIRFQNILTVLDYLVAVEKICDWQLFHSRLAFSADFAARLLSKDPLIN